MDKIKSIFEYFFYLLEKYFLTIKYYYLKTNFYNFKISKNIPTKYLYRPSPHIINCLISFRKKKIKIENLSLNSIWKIDPKKNNEFVNLHSFLWLTTLDIKTSKTITQNLIENWIDNNQNFNKQTWKLDILSKRIIAWISNLNLTLNASSLVYSEKFTLSIAKQINHLFNIIENEKKYENKIIGCASLILISLVFKEYKKYFNSNLEILQKVIKINFNNDGFPKSRNPQELFECLKYFVIIREWIKESQNQIPEFINNIVYETGNSFMFISQRNTKLPLFNGATELDSQEFRSYLKNTNYIFKKNTLEKGGYTILGNKKILLIMDVGNSPEKKFSTKYQCGCLSFEIISNDKKLICNSGFYFKNKNRLNTISRSTAAHSTLYINNHSSCSIKKSYFFHKNYDSKLLTSLKVKSKKINVEKDFEQVVANHDGYKKKYGFIHERKIKFVKDKKIFLGSDHLIAQKKAKKINFGIRFHIYPNIKMVKTRESNSILLKSDNGDGWRFNCINYEIFIENGLYLGDKNKLIKNENIYISGVAQNENQLIEWSFEKIS